MLQLIDICKDYGTKTVLNKINLAVYDGEKIGIIGDNGQGKSTLLNIITKQISADSGEVAGNEVFGFLKQSSELSLDEIIKELNNKTLATQFNIELKKLGFEKDFELTKSRLEKLSCGERTKIALALAFAKNPTVLVLDEPTNHLDIFGKKVMVEQVKSFNKTVIIVSHDKDFLNQTVDKIWELKDGKIKEYYGNYDDYKIQKENEQLNVARTYEEHKKQAAKIQEDIVNYKRAAEMSQNKMKSPKAHEKSKKSISYLSQEKSQKKLAKFAQSKISQLEHQLKNDVERPDKEVKIRYHLQSDEFKPRFAFIAENLSKKFGGNSLFENADFTIETGEKIALMGNNGCGKSTLINILLGKESYEGTLRAHPNLKIATMFQDVYDIDPEATINELSLQEDKQYRTNFITNLCSMNIDKSRFDTKVKFLSSGEKMRIKLSQLILSDANMLIFDEPTNHLDIINKDFLQDVLAGYQGTVLIVSHDIDFLKHTTNKVLKIENKTITDSL